MNARNPILLLILGSMLGAALVPGPASALDLGTELRFYPAGIIPALRGDLPVGSADRLVLSAGYNITDRQDWGVHQSEKGSGPGIGVGWFHDFGEGPRGWLLGARADLWRLDIDWEDPESSGTSKVTVLQPTVGGGYRFGGERFRFEVTLSVGSEFNVATDGAAVGEGAILLVGFGALFRL